MEILKRDQYFQCNKIVLCENLKLFSSQWDYWIWWFEFVFLVILSKLRVQCVILENGFNTLLVHFVFVLGTKKQKWEYMFLPKKKIEQNLATF
jgi:hypothetical protein